MNFDEDDHYNNMLRVTCIIHCVSKKRLNFKMVQLKITRSDFDEIWQKYSEYSRTEFVCFSFHVGVIVITLSSLKLHTKNNACFFWKSWVALKRTICLLGSCLQGCSEKSRF